MQYAQLLTPVEVEQVHEASGILTRDNPVVFSAQVDAAIMERFSDLVPGDAKWED